MNNSQKIELLNIQSRRKIILVALFSVVTFVIMMIFSIDSWHTVLAILGLMVAILLFAFTLSHFQGILVNIDSNDKALLFNYEYLLSNKKKCREFMLDDIRKLEYSTFRALLTIESSRDKLTLNIKDSEKTPIKIFVDRMKSNLRSNYGLKT